MKAGGILEALAIALSGDHRNTHFRRRRPGRGRARPGRASSGLVAALQRVVLRDPAKGFEPSPETRKLIASGVLGNDDMQRHFVEAVARADYFRRWRNERRRLRQPKRVRRFTVSRAKRKAERRTQREADRSLADGGAR